MCTDNPEAMTSQLTQKDWSIIFECVNPHNTIFLEPNRPVFVKHISQQANSKSCTLENELQVYHKLHNLQGHIVPLLLGFDSNEKGQFLVTSFTEGDSFAHTCSFETVSLIVSSLKAIHQAGVIHCDLKPGMYLDMRAYSQNILSYNQTKPLLLILICHLLLDSKSNPSRCLGT